MSETGTDIPNSSDEWRRHALGLLGEQLDDVSVLFETAANAYREPLEGSRHAADLSWVRAHELRSQYGDMASGACEDMQRILVSSLDFVEALQALLKQERLLPVPMLSLVRSVFDTVMWVAHMLDPTISSEMRLLRVADHRLATAAETIAANAVLGVDNADSLENREQLVAWYGRVGIVEKLTKKGARYSVLMGDVEQSCQWSTTKVAEWAAPRARYLWKHGSGATHNEFWFTAELSGPDEQVLALIVSSLFSISDVLTDVLAGYLDFDAAPIHEATHQRRHRLHAGPHGTPAEQTYTAYLEQADALLSRS